MKKLIKRVLSVGMAAVMMTGVFAGCSSKEADKPSGTISLAGSTSMEKLCEAMSESFMEKYPEITVTVEYTGSGAGIEALNSGSIDVGNSSRSLKDSELTNGAVENVVAIDGIAVITERNNSVTDISAENLAKVYTGEITNWKELGGKDREIVAFQRPAGSGSQSMMKRMANTSYTPSKSTFCFCIFL